MSVGVREAVGGTGVSAGRAEASVGIGVDVAEGVAVGAAVGVNVGAGGGVRVGVTAGLDGNVRV